MVHDGGVVLVRDDLASAEEKEESRSSSAQANTRWLDARLKRRAMLSTVSAPIVPQRLGLGRRRRAPPASWSRARGRPVAVEAKSWGDIAKDAGNLAGCAETFIAGAGLCGNEISQHESSHSSLHCCDCTREVIGKISGPLKALVKKDDAAIQERRTGERRQNLAPRKPGETTQRDRCCLCLNAPVASARNCCLHHPSSMREGIF